MERIEKWNDGKELKQLRIAAGFKNPDQLVAATKKIDPAGKGVSRSLVYQLEFCAEHPDDPSPWNQRPVGSRTGALLLLRKALGIDWWLL